MSKYFHDELKGCEIEVTYREHKVRSEIVSTASYKCLTHNVDICHCGWEYGHHYDTDSKEIWEAEGRRSVVMLKHICKSCGKEFEAAATRKNVKYCCKACLFEGRRKI